MPPASPASGGLGEQEWPVSQTVRPDAAILTRIASHTAEGEANAGASTIVSSRRESQA